LPKRSHYLWKKPLNTWAPKINPEQDEDVMKLLLDEMYAGLKEYFETLGYEVLTAQEAGLKGAKDREVVEYAGKHGLLLVTQDQKPAELAELTGVKCVLISNGMIAKIADAQIKEKYRER
jgi:predicted nuclease of predicted toxin-antitoxin system